MSSRKLVKSQKFHSTFEEFSKNVTIVEPNRYVRKDEYDQDYLDSLESFYVYGAGEMDDGSIDGCVIEKDKNGMYSCNVSNDDVYTESLDKAERFLYENWYKYSCS